MAGPGLQSGSTPMRIASRELLAALALSTSLSGLMACSRGSPPAPLSPSGSAGHATADACQRVKLRLDDLAGILNEPVTLASPVPGDGQSCAYLTAGFPAITISLRPGVGKSALDAWMHGKMPFEARPIAGVGEAALWQAGLHELIARREDLLCDVQVRAGTNDLALTPDALSRAAGDLCNKIFGVPQP